MTPRRQLFVEHYAGSWNATQSAMNAGYSAKTAYSQGQQLLKKVVIQEALAKEVKRMRTENAITVDRVLEEYRRIAFAQTTDMVTVKGGWVTIADTDDLTVEQKAAISEIHQMKEGGVKVRFHSKIAALEALGKYFALFTERVEIENVGPPPVINVVFKKAETPTVEGPAVIEGEFAALTEGKEKQNT